MSGKKYEGGVSVSGDATVGGNGTVRGNMQVGHNLKVEGWVEARNVKDTNKGLFMSEARLKELYPEPQEGWMALVGTSLPAKVYVCVDGKWQATGGTGGNPNFDIEKLDQSVRAVWLTDGTDELANAQPHLHVRYNNGEITVGGMLMAGDANGGMLRKAHFRRFSEAAAKVADLEAQVKTQEADLSVVDKRSIENQEAARGLRKDADRSLSYVWLENGTEDNAQLKLCFRLIDGSVYRAGIPMANASNTTAGILSFADFVEFRNAVNGVSDLYRQLNIMNSDITRLSNGVAALSGNNAGKTLANYHAIQEIMADAETKEQFFYSLSQYTKEVDRLGEMINTLSDDVEALRGGVTQDLRDYNSRADTISAKLDEAISTLNQTQTEMSALRDDTKTAQDKLTDSMDALDQSVKKQMSDADVYFKKIDTLADETTSMIDTAKSELSTSVANAISHSDSNKAAVEEKLKDHSQTVTSLRTELTENSENLEGRVAALEGIHSAGLTDDEIDGMLVDEELSA